MLKRFGRYRSLLLLLIITILTFTSACSDEEIEKDVDVKVESIKDNKKEESLKEEKRLKEEAEKLEEEKRLEEEAKKLEEERIEQERKEELAKGFVRAEVTKHIDGDTIHVTLDDGQILKIRMIGIDTPETVHPSKPIEFYGQEASDFTKEKSFGKTVYLEKDVSETDRYGRSLRYVWMEIPEDINKEEIGTKMLNGILVAQGFANSSTYQPDVKYQDYFLELERDARNGSIGFWDENKANEFEKANTNNSNTSTEQTNSNISNNTSPQVNDTPINSGYLANSNTGKFHYGDCKHAKKIANHNRVEFSNREEAIGSGYVPCKVCRP